jgi:hypothetical protein
MDAPAGPGAFVFGPGQVQGQRVAAAGGAEQDQRPRPEHLGHAEGPRVERDGAVVLGHQQVDVADPGEAHGPASLFD